MANDQDHDEESVEIAFCDPRESAGDSLGDSLDEAAFFFGFIGFIVGFEAPFEMVMARDAEFDEEGIEPADGDDHERANDDGDVEIIDRGVMAEEWEIFAEHIEPVTEPEHESDIGDVVGDCIEPFAAMAWAQSHTREFAVDAVDHRRDLP